MIAKGRHAVCREQCHVATIFSTNELDQRPQLDSRSIVKYDTI